MSAEGRSESFSLALENWGRGFLPRVSREEGSCPSTTVTAIVLIVTQLKSERSDAILAGDFTLGGDIVRESNLKPHF